MSNVIVNVQKGVIPPVTKNNIKVNSHGQLTITNINLRAAGVWECTSHSWNIGYHGPRKTYTTTIDIQCRF